MEKQDNVLLEKKSQEELEQLETEICKNFFRSIVWNLVGIGLYETEDANCIINTLKDK